MTGIKRTPAPAWSMNLVGIILVMASCLLGACATLSPDWEDPTVTLQSFRALPSEGMSPSFEIQLNVINPNSTDLELAGIVYTISLQGHDLVKGVGKDFPVIESYSQETVTLTGSANLLAGIRMFTDLAREKQSLDLLEYQFEAKLDLAGPYPSIRVKEQGVLGGAPSD